MQKFNKEENHGSKNQVFDKIKHIDKYKWMWTWDIYVWVEFAFVD